MKAVILSNPSKPEGKKAIQTCTALKKHSPWLETECVDLSQNGEVRKKYHIKRTSGTSYIIFDDNGKELIRGKGIIPEKYLTTLMHEHHRKV